MPDNETPKPGDIPVGETVTPPAGSEAEKNNTSNGSEAGPAKDKTQENGKGNDTAQDRIRELVDKGKEKDVEIARLIALIPPDKKDNKPADNANPPKSQDTAGDDAWKRGIEVALKAPERLKEKAEDMAKYWSQHPTLPIQDVIDIFDARNKVDPEAAAKQAEADAAASTSRTGGTSSPAARQSAAGIKSMKTDELKSELEARMSRGEKI